ncbi:unnamed protein product [Thelazia callipaeda]|uniref:Secreted protein n=1 Tax=Thelazia callipaeda TaxID=103827 RepID=A0A0N5D409_THECL|nr:unnamed protein product [Thelazia callipaeda]
MWKLVFVFTLVLALDRIPALWMYLYQAQICYAHRSRFVLVESTSIVKEDAFERLRKNDRLNVCLDMIRYTDLLRITFMEVCYNPVPYHHIPNCFGFAFHL